MEKPFENVLVSVELMEGKAMWNKIEDIVGGGDSRGGQVAL